MSDDHHVISGVPQGTVLGPLLLIIMISDINRDVVSSKLISFADDTRVYSQIADTEDYDSLQQDLNSVYHWASDNNMFLNSLSATGDTPTLLTSGNLSRHNNS